MHADMLTGRKEDPVNPELNTINAEDQIALLAAIVDSSEDVIISKTLDGIITSWNNAAVRVFGYTAEEMIGRSITTLIPHDRLEEEPAIIEKLRRGERVEHFETKRRRKDGSLLDISLTISPIRNHKGQVIGASKIARDITLQKQKEQLIIESEERLRLAIDSTQLGTWEFYPSENKLNWSDQCRAIYDVPQEVPVDFEFFKQHIFPDDREYALQEIGKSMDPNGPGNYNIEYRIIRYSDKRPRWISARGKVYFDNTGNPKRFIGTVLDITERKDTELKLRDSIELFTMMANNVPAMIWMSGEDIFKDYFNNTWLEFTGRTIEQERNEGWLNNVHPDDRHHAINNYKHALKEEIGFYTEYRLRRFDGEYRWIADNAAPRFSPDGSFIGFISACIDIDDQKTFSEKIRESELMLNTISNASPVGLWMTDMDGQNTFVNDTWIKWTGIPFEDQLGTGWLNKVVDEDRAVTIELLEKALAKRKKFSTEFRLQRIDGSLRYCYTESFPYFDLNGSFAGYAGSVTDITDIKRMEQRKDDFIRMASHELKTPITSIGGYVQLLQNLFDEANAANITDTGKIIRPSLDTISRQVAKLTRLVSELLDLSRIESGKLEMHPTSFSLNELAEEIIQEVRHTTTTHAIVLENNFHGNIRGDRDRISQVLLNLLTNAIKYSPGADQVKVTINEHEGNAVICVVDKGIGIESTEQDKIFERFYRVEGKSEQTYPGFGIGLFIASEIVKRHHGKLTVKSERGKGSEFCVEMPVDIKIEEKAV